MGRFLYSTLLSERRFSSNRILGSRDTKKGICLCYPTNHNDSAKCLFLGGSDPLLHESMDFDELTLRLKGNLVRSGLYCLGRRSEPLFLVSVIASRPASSHWCAVSRTRSQTDTSSMRFSPCCRSLRRAACGPWSPLAWRTSSSAWIPSWPAGTTRPHSWGHFISTVDLKSLCCPWKSACFLFLLHFRSAGKVLKMLWWMLLRAPRPRSGFWSVGSSWLDAEKKRWAAELPEQHQGQGQGHGGGSAAAVSVSSNDVLVSWFSSTLGGSAVG